MRATCSSGRCRRSRSVERRARARTSPTSMPQQGGDVLIALVACASSWSSALCSSVRATGGEPTEWEPADRGCRVAADGTETRTESRSPLRRADRDRMDRATTRTTPASGSPSAMSCASRRARPRRRPLGPGGERLLARQLPRRLRGGQGRDGPVDQRQLPAADHRGTRRGRAPAPATAAAPPGSGRPRCATTRAASAPSRR